MPTSPNMVAIETVTVQAGGTGAIQFNNIPQIYNDLKILISSRTDRNATDDDLKVLVNGSSAGVYINKRLYGNGSGTGSDGLSNTGVPYTGAGTGATATASTFGNCEFYFPNYTSTTAKAMNANAVSENNATAAFQVFSSWLWNPGTQAAINSIAIYPYNGTSFSEHSTATLYGITNAAYSATGGLINSTSEYYYHTFTESGTFRPSSNLTCDVLLIAGGGGGGGGLGGGGGAGGVVLVSQQPFSANTNYSIAVGAGGAGSGGSTYGSVGSNSTISSYTALGGGGGSSGSQGTFPTGNGGSGGGGGNSHAAGIATQGSGSGYTGYGNNGGGNANSAASGGGGAGSVGATNNTYGADGGAGTGLFDTWARATGTGVLSNSTYYYAGGGAGSQDRYNQGSLAGGIGGVGGGGNGADAGGSASQGVTNTGGGGGGGGNNSGQGVAGGSGLVIIRYAK